MKNIITLALLLYTSSNIVLASDATTIKTIPISYEITINNLQTKISNLEARRSMLAWLDHIRTPWTCFVITLIVGSIVAIQNECYGLVNAICSFVTPLCVTMSTLQIARFFAEKEIPLLQQQIDRLIAKSQQECNISKE